MDWIHFQNPERIVWMLGVLAVVVFFAWSVIVRRGELGRFVGPAMQAGLVRRQSGVGRVIQVVCMALAGSLLVLAAMRPQTVRVEHQTVGRDSANILVALDVSKSMLATDSAPNRLERAKSEIRDMLPSFAAHRVGLIAFAGRATVLSPLTQDHGFFRLVLDGASPESVTLGGTNIGEVIRKGTSLLGAQEGPKAMILITDGEDHDSYPLEAAEEARRAGVAIVTVGFGSPDGAPIDVLDRATGRRKRVTDSAGREVISKLDEKLLTDIAVKTGGVYVPAATGVIDLDGIMQKHILPLVEESDRVRVVENRVELFQWFLIPGLIFLIGMMLPEGRMSRAVRRAV